MLRSRAIRSSARASFPAGSCHSPTCSIFAVGFDPAKIIRTPTGARLHATSLSFTEKYDVVVVGAGHAGCEAAMGAARMGLKTALYTMNLDLVAQMSCNPAVGGIAKGHLVREVDALGGVMGEVIDAVGIQFRLLNTSRGPAVWSPRAQADKKQYRVKMRQVLEAEPNLRIKQAEVTDLWLEDRSADVPPASGVVSDESTRRRVRGVRLRDGRTVEAGAVVIT